MRIIDEKGRLFGKINIIDFLVILFLLSLTPMVYFGYRISKRPPEPKSIIVESIKIEKAERPKKELVEITIQGKFIKLKPKIIPLIHVGDVEYDVYGNLLGKIVDLGKFQPYIRTIEIGSNKKLKIKNSEVKSEDKFELKEAEVTLKIYAEVKGKNIYYNDRQLLEGGTFEFSPVQYYGPYGAGAEIEDIKITQ